MSAICPSCGAVLPDDADACAACGAAAPERGGTAVEPVPPHQEEPSPIRFDVAQTHWFGVAPASLLLGLAAVASVGAIVLFVTGRWPIALVLLGLVLLLLASFGEVAKRKPDTRVARRSLAAFRSARDRAGVAVESASARARAGRELARARHELHELLERRRAKIAELGEAALADDAARTRALKGEIGELDRHVGETEAEMETIAARARDGIERARLSVQETQMVAPPEGASDRRAS